MNKEQRIRCSGCTHDKYEGCGCPPPDYYRTCWACEAYKGMTDELIQFIRDGVEANSWPTVDMIEAERLLARYDF